MIFFQLFWMTSENLVQKRQPGPDKNLGVIIATQVKRVTKAQLSHN